MTQPASNHPPELRGPSDEPADMLRWHAGWAAAAAVVAVVNVISRAPPVLILALLAGVAPAVAAGLLPMRAGDTARSVLLVVWGLAMAVAATLAGGLTGPLAAWCVMPLAAATVLGGTRHLAQGAAASVLALALAALAEALGLTGAGLAGGAAFGLCLFGLTSAVVALAFGLMLDRRRLNRRIDAEAAGKTALDVLLTNQPNLILWLEDSGRVQAAFGHPPADVSIERLKADGLASLCARADQPNLQLMLTEAAEMRSAELSFPLAGGEGVWLTLSLRGLAGSGLVGVLRDITAEREREHDLERARLDAEALNIGKSRFLANMSHELRTPLNAIMGFSDIMRARLFGALPGKYSEYADLIHDAGSHLLDLINDVLDMSKIEASRYELRREDMDAREPVSAALRLMRLQADDVGVKLRGVLPAEALEANADRRALKQITLNLISNALKFTPRGGLVTVSLTQIGGALELAVVDTGVGIAKSDLSRLGRPFEQAGDLGQKARGTGLGLSLVRAFAELHGGEMGIESQLGEGTAVTVRLPVLVGETAAAAPATAEALPTAGAKVIPFKPQR